MYGWLVLGQVCLVRSILSKIVIVPRIIFRRSWETDLRITGRNESSKFSQAVNYIVGFLAIPQKRTLPCNSGVSMQKLSTKIVTEDWAKSSQEQCVGHGCWANRGSGHGDVMRVSSPTP